MELRTLTSEEFSTLILNSIESVSLGAEISIADSVIMEEIKIEIDYSNITIRNQLRITNCTFKNKFQLKNFITQTTVSFDNCKFEGEFDLESFRSSGSFKIQKCNFKKIVKLTELDCQSVGIEETNFESDLNFYKPFIHNNLDLFYCNIKHTLLIQDLNEKSVVNIQSNKDKFINCVFITNASNIRIGNLEREIKINGIKLSSNEKITLQCNLVNIKVNDFSIRRLSEKSVINLNDIISLSSEKNVLEIADSNLNNSSFKDCDFSNFDLNFQNSKIEGLELSGSTLPQPNRINKNNIFGIKHTIDALQAIKKKLESKGDTLNSSKYFETEMLLKLETLGDNNFSNKKDIYSQLKKMYEQRGDSVKALEYQAKELDVYRKGLKCTWKNTPEIINLWINRWTNNYGTSWFLAFCVTILINGIFFSLYCSSIGFTLGDNWDIFWELTSYSFEFLNPLRKAEFIQTIDGVQVKYGNWSRVIDYSARIIVTLCVYQLIQAFRKYGKK